VVGECHVFVALRGAGGDHLVDRVLSVRPGGVHLEITAQVRKFDEMGELSPVRGFELSLVGPDLRRDPREPDRGVDILFRSSGDTFPELPAGGARDRPGSCGIGLDVRGFRLRLLFSQLEHAVLRHAQTLREGELAELDVVLL
jgi:hypothetical protein